MTSEYTVEELKELLLEAQIESKQPYLNHLKRQEELVRQAIEERGIPEFHDIWDGRKTANMTDIVNKYAPKPCKHPEIDYTGYSQPYVDHFLPLLNQGLLGSHVYTIWLLIILYIYI